MFIEALDLAEAPRRSLLASLEAEDPDLAHEVRTLIAAHEGPGLLPRDPVPKDQDGANAPRLFGLERERFGSYRIVRRLGQGGMGTVYLAERTGSDFAQTVALKLLRMEFATPALVDRFTAERRILARLEHPGIARLIDAGTTESGHPFLAMEFVDGKDIVTWCRERGASVPDRLRLFLEVCQAVDYAHRQLVIHRDLKPANILVTAEGRPKLLDFGVAKLLDPDGSEIGAPRTGQWFTPEYASPEQIQGGPVTTLSDVYALGVLLYELLSGVQPFDFRGAAPAAVVEAIGEREAAPPSERPADPGLQRLLRGDLDTIVLKAMAKEPGRRYDSVRDLAGDVRRHLRREPVRARPDTWPYRAHRFMQRNRIPVAAGGLVLLSLSIGVGAVVRQGAVARSERDRAELARAESEEVTSQLIGLFRLADPWQGGLDTATARAILRRGEVQIEALAGQPAVQARMLDALSTVFENLGQLDRAGELAQRSLANRRSHLDPSDPDIAISLRRVGRTSLLRSRYPEAEAAYREALALREQVFGRRSGPVAESLRDLGFLMPYLARSEESVALYRRALEVDLEVLGTAHPQVAQDYLLVGLALRRLNRLAEAIELIEQAVAMKDRLLGPDDPDAATARFHLADQLTRAGRTARAESLYREGIATRRRAVGPGDLGLPHGLENLASLLSDQGRHGEAEALLREALDIRLATVGPEAPATAGSLGLMAAELLTQGRSREALDLRLRSIDIFRSAIDGDHTSVASALSGLADVYLQLGWLVQAERYAQDALDMRLRLHGPTHQHVGFSFYSLGEIRRRQGRLAEAQDYLSRALVILEPEGVENQPLIRSVHRSLAQVHQAAGRPAEAARHARLAGGR